MPSTQSGGSLEELPNVGPALAMALRSIGIHDAETLREVGALAAWHELYDAGLFDCLHSRSALEGAVRGIPKALLDDETKDRLRSEVSDTRRP